MPARFLAPDAERPGDVVDLPHEEAQHLVRVLRLKAGAAVRVFNGRGGEFEAVVDAVSKVGARVRLQAPCDVPQEPRVAVTLAQAVLKGDKMDDVVRDAVMMGVAAIQPVVTARSEVSLGSLQRGRRQERWSRIAVSSAKQCGRAVVPSVFEPRAMEGAMPTVSGAGPSLEYLMFVEPSATADTRPLTDLSATPPAAVTLFVGPEGGWSPGEIARGAASGRLVTLGSRTLRADAMALVALSALMTHWRELSR